MSGIYWLASYPGAGNAEFHILLRTLIKGDQQTTPDTSHLTTASSRGWLDDVLGFDTAELHPDDIERLRPLVYRWSVKAEEIGYYPIHDAYTFTRDGEPLVSGDATLGALYILRSPLDVARSYAYRNHCSIDQAIQRMGESSNALCDDRQSLSSEVRQKLLTWSEHVLSWADAPGLNCHVIRYEDLLHDPFTTVTEAARFLRLAADPAQVATAIRCSGVGTLLPQVEQASDGAQPAEVERSFSQDSGVAQIDRLTSEQIARIIEQHGSVMRRFGYLDARNQPVRHDRVSHPSRDHAQGDEGAKLPGEIHIETPRFVIRRMRPSDVTDAYVSWWNDEKIQAGLNARPRDWNRVKAENHVRSHDGRKRIHLGIHRKQGPLVGFMTIVLHQEGRLAELTLVIGEKNYWGKSVPDETLPHLFDNFFSRYPTVKFKCLIATYNRSSLAGVRRIGFVPEGVLKEEWDRHSGGRTDVHVYSLLKRDWLQRRGASE